MTSDDLQVASSRGATLHHLLVHITDQHTQSWPSSGTGTGAGTPCLESGGFSRFARTALPFLCVVVRLCLCAASMYFEITTKEIQTVRNTTNFYKNHYLPRSWLRVPPSSSQELDISLLTPPRTAHRVCGDWPGHEMNNTWT